VFHNLLISGNLQRERELSFADFRQLLPISADFGRIFSHRLSHGFQPGQRSYTQQTAGCLSHLTIRDSPWQDSRVPFRRWIWPN